MGRWRRVGSMGASVAIDMARRDTPDCVSPVWTIIRYLIVRGSIVLQGESFVHASLITPPRESSCARSTRRRYSPRQVGTGGIAGGVGAPERDRPLLHEQHRTRPAESGDRVDSADCAGAGYDADGACGGGAALEKGTRGRVPPRDKRARTDISRRRCTSTWMSPRGWIVAPLPWLSDEPRAASLNGLSLFQCPGAARPRALRRPSLQADAA